MKKLFLTAFILFSAAVMYGQETMYVMKNGVATAQYNIATQVDSVVFYDPIAQPPVQNLKIALTGDSITHGSGIGRAAYYRKPLYYLLTNAGITVDYVGFDDKFYGENPFDDASLDPDMDWDRDHCAMWGQTTPTVASNYVSWVTAEQAPDVVLIHIGTNDYYTYQATTDGYKSIINKSRELNPNVVIFIAKLIKANPDSHNAANVTNETRWNDYVVPQVLSMSTAQSPIIGVDQYADFDVSTDMYDSLHPNWNGANKMANKWMEAISAHYGL